MLSIIISSYQQQYFDALEKNIRDTVGVPYEIIRIKNPGIMGICEAYNQGGSQARFDNILFLHEDVEFTTVNWGTILIRHLEKSEIGIVGLAGSIYVPNVPFAWWDNFEDTRINLVQYQGDKRRREYTLRQAAKCSVIDGVFLACRKEVWRKYPFNNKLFGFHGYDIDFSSRVSSEYQNITISDITLKHFSEGNPDHLWFNALIKYRPFFNAPSSQKINKKKELFYFLKFAEKCRQFNVTNKKCILLKYNHPKYIGYKASAKNIFKIIFS